MDIQGIFEGLIEFFDLAPNGTRNQFVNAVDNQGIAVPGDTNLWLDHFLSIGDGMGLISSADFDVMMEKRRDVGLDKATNGARAIYDQLVKVAEFRISRLEAEVVLLQAIVTATETKITNISTARVWIEANAPGGPEIKADTLEALDFGSSALSLSVEELNVSISQREAEIVGLGGTV